MPVNKELVVCTVVLTYDSTVQGFSYPKFDLRVLESELGTSVEVQRIYSERGEGQVIRMHRDRLEVLLLPERVEVRDIEATTLNARHVKLSQVLLAIAGYFPQGNWKLIGYNYIYNLESSEMAIQRIATSVLDVSTLKEKLGYPVTGAGLWLWMQVDQSILWLRLEPRARDRQTNRVWVEANFEEVVTHQLPTEGDVSKKITQYNEILKQVLAQLNLW
jgi:hypothetical protein